MRTLLALPLLLTAACGSSTPATHEPASTTAPVATGPAPAGTTPAPVRSGASPAATPSRCEQMGGRCQSPLAQNICGSWKDGADTGCTGGWGCCLPK